MIHEDKTIKLENDSVYVIEVPGILSKEQIKKMQEGWKKFHDERNIDFLILEAGVKIARIDKTAEKGKRLEVGSLIYDQAGNALIHRGSGIPITVRDLVLSDIIPHVKE